MRRAKNNWLLWVEWPTESRSTSARRGAWTCVRTEMQQAAPAKRRTDEPPTRRQADPEEHPQRIEP